MDDGLLYKKKHGVYEKTVEYRRPRISVIPVIRDILNKHDSDHPSDPTSSSTEELSFQKSTAEGSSREKDAEREDRLPVRRSRSKEKEMRNGTDETVSPDE